MLPMSEKQNRGIWICRFVLMDFMGLMHRFHIIFWKMQRLIRMLLNAFEAFWIYLTTLFTNSIIKLGNTSDFTPDLKEDWIFSPEFCSQFYRATWKHPMKPAVIPVFSYRVNPVREAWLLC